LVLNDYIPTKNGFAFAGWYTDEGLTTPASLYLSINANITLYAKWVSSSELDRVKGVWTRTNEWDEWDNTIYTLIVETDWYWEFQGTYLSSPQRWTLADFPLTDDGDTLTTAGYYTWHKKTATQTPNSDTSLNGEWLHYNSQTLTISGGTATLTYPFGEQGPIDFKYHKTEDTFTLLYGDGNIVVLEWPIGIYDGITWIDSFSKKVMPANLIGTWNLNKTYTRPNSYWVEDVPTGNDVVSYTLTSSGGTFYSHGASIPITWFATEAGYIYIDGDEADNYTLSGDTLTIGGNGYKKFDFSKGSVPATTATRDSELAGTWSYTVETNGGSPVTYRMTVNMNGTIATETSQDGESYPGAPFIWWTGVEGGTKYFYSVKAGSIFESYSSPTPSYTISGNILVLTTISGGGDGVGETQQILTRQ
jgi:uncharacterized repeat protein (TIGR02543 family)